LAGTSPRPAALKLLNGRSPGTGSGGRKVAPPAAFARVAADPLTRNEADQGNRPGSLAAYCESWARFVEISEAWHTGDAQWAREFGLTPSAEGAVRPPELPDGDDPFA
jgi:phage terminase small subunit